MISRIYTQIRKTPWQLLLVALLGGLAYSNSFHVPFVFDDYPNIVENRAVENLAAFFSSHVRSSRWVALATFAANGSIGGTGVAGFHAVNLCIHLLSGISIYLLARTTLGTFDREDVQRYALVPFVAALGFVLHPVQTQAVVYIVQRMTSLAALFYLVTLLLYAKAFTENRLSDAATRTGCYGSYTAALVSCLLALGTKEISLTLPAVIALYDVLFLKGTVRQRLLRLFPFVLCTAVMAFSLIGIDKGMDAVVHGGGDEWSYPLPRLTYLLTECRVMITYLRLLVLPVAQNLDYSYPVYDSLQPPVAASLAVIVASLVFGGLCIRNSLKQTCRYRILLRVAGFALLWFYITLSIESGVIPLLDTIFEHRLYLPSVWFFVVCALAAAELYHRLPRYKTAVAALTAVLMVSSGHATYQRNSVWKDRASLWSDVLKKAPDNPRALTNLGKYHVDRMEPAKALPLLERAVRLKPDYAPAHYSLGVALVQSGDSERALRHYVLTTGLAPKNPKGWEDAGRLLLEKGRYRDAALFLRRAYELNPSAFTAQEKAWLSRTF